MKSRFLPAALALLALCLPVITLAQAPAPCPCAAVSDDQADMAEAVARAFGSRIAVGPFREATLAIRAWRTADKNDLPKLQTRLGRTPRFTACQKATMAVIALEMTNAFSPGTIPPQVLALAIQLQQAACGVPPVPVPTPTPTPGPVPVPVPVPHLAPPDVHTILVAAHRPTGAKASPRHKLMAAPRFKAVGVTPPQFACVPPQLSMWGNSSYGDCVSAEEAFAKAAASVALGQPELFLTESTVVKWAGKHGFLNGANLTEVMDAMARDGMSDGTTTYGDGPYSAIDWTNRASLTNAITVGPVKIGVAAGQLQSVVGNGNGWVLAGAYSDQNIDHCVALCGYGSVEYCCQTLGTTVPKGVDGKADAYLLFTWNTIGVIDQKSLNAICGEAWLRNPTTIVGPQPTPVPTPTPTPGPTPRPPTRLLTTLLKDIDALTDKYQNGTPAQRKQVLSLLSKVQADVKATKQKLGIAP